MTDKPKPSFWQWLLKNSLWFVAGGLMFFSASFDGAYLQTLSVIRGFGYAINLFADIANPAMRYWYGRLQQDKYKAKRDKSRSILKWEWVAIAYSWLFSWRQLRGRVYLVETEPLASKLGYSGMAAVIEIELLAFAFAGFVPLMLAGIGALQALIAGRIEEGEEESKPEAEPQEAAPEPEPLDPSLWPRATYEDALRVTAGMNGERATLTYAELKRRLTEDEKSTDKQRSSVYRWKDRIKEEEVERVN